MDRKPVIDNKKKSRDIALLASILGNSTVIRSK